jgi:hypothetical protein
VSKPPRVLKHAFEQDYYPGSSLNDENLRLKLCRCDLPSYSEVHFDIETQEEYRARTGPVTYHVHGTSDLRVTHDHQGLWREHTHPMPKPDLPEPDRRLFDRIEGREPGQ